VARVTIKARSRIRDPGSSDDEIDWREEEGESSRGAQGGRSGHGGRRSGSVESGDLAACMPQDRDGQLFPHRPAHYSAPRRAASVGAQWDRDWDWDWDRAERAAGRAPGTYVRAGSSVPVVTPARGPHAMTIAFADADPTCCREHRGRRIKSSIRWWRWAQRADHDMTSTLFVPEC
jgi:hypothetical protein